MRATTPIRHRRPKSRDAAKRGTYCTAVGAVLYCCRCQPARQSQREQKQAERAQQIIITQDSTALQEHTTTHLPLDGLDGVHHDRHRARVELLKALLSVDVHPRQPAPEPRVGVIPSHNHLHRGIESNQTRWQIVVVVVVMMVCVHDDHRARACGGGGFMTILSGPPSSSDQKIQMYTFIIHRVPSFHAQP